MKFKYSYSIKDFFNKDYLFLCLLFFSMGIINICMSLAVWLGEERKCSAAVAGLDAVLMKSVFKKVTSLLCIVNYSGYNELCGWGRLFLVEIVFHV